MAGKSKLKLFHLINQSQQREIMSQKLNLSLQTDIYSQSFAQACACQPIQD